MLVWQEVGNAALVELSKARCEVLIALRAIGPAPLKDVCEYVERDKGNTLRLLQGLESEGLAVQDGNRGPWKLHNSQNFDSLEQLELSELFKLWE